MRAHFSFMITLITLFFLSGCNSDNAAAPEGDTNDTLSVMTLRSGLERDAAPDTTPQEFDTLVSDNNAFAWDLYQRLGAEESGALFFSPVSISAALAMTYAGAEGNTETQMRGALHMTLPEARFHAAFNALALQLQSRSSDENNITLDLSNALWGELSYQERFQESFLDTLALNYGAGVQLLDFINAAEPSRLTINRWVEEQTQEKIKDLLPPGSISPLTRLVLTNAVYFNAAWAAPFDANLTADAPFTTREGTTMAVAMMHHKGHYGYYDGTELQAIALPYKGATLEMMILLPDSGRFDAVETSLDAETIAQIRAEMSDKEVQLGLPKFRFETDSISLRNPLIAMGMNDAFDALAADFSGIDGSRDLMIDDVIHKAFISVTEQGTEAAAATAVIFVGTSVPDPEQSVTMTIDRPFIYLIREREHGQILFLGRMDAPIFGE